MGRMFQVSQDWLSLERRKELHFKSIHISLVSCRSAAFFRGSQCLILWRHESASYILPACAPRKAIFVFASTARVPPSGTITVAPGLTARRLSLIINQPDPSRMWNTVAGPECCAIFWPAVIPTNTTTRLSVSNNFFGTGPSGERQRCLSRKDTIIFLTYSHPLNWWLVSYSLIDFYSRTSQNFGYLCSISRWPADVACRLTTSRGPPVSADWSTWIIKYLEVTTISFPL